jgi:hypothetical protein
MRDARVWRVTEIADRRLGGLATPAFWNIYKSE